MTRRRRREPRRSGEPRRPGGPSEASSAPASPARLVEAKPARSPTAPGSPKRPTTAPRSPALEAVAVSKDYWGQAALDSLHLNIASGERTLLVGPNGSGKTTLLRLAAGLLEPSAGRIRVLGAEAGTLEARALTSYVADRPALYDDLSLAEQLEYVARLHAAAEWERRAGLLLSAFGLEARADDLPSGFSQGQRQRAALALALVRPFRLLLLDEPFTGLDPSGRESLLRVLDDVADAGAAVVVVSHGRDYLDQATRCVGLVDGRMAYDGPANADAIQRLVG